MMQDLVRILRDSELDRETKLRIIEIVSVSQDEEMVKDLVDILKQWDEADNKAEEETARAFAAIQKKYEDTVEELDEATGDQLEQLEGEVNKEDDISNLKNSILDS